MDSEFSISLGAAQKLEFAFQRNEEDSSVLEWLSTGSNLKLIGDVVRGFAEIKPIAYLIDFDANPFCPTGLTVAPGSDQIAGRVRGKVRFDQIAVSLYLDDDQANNRLVGGYDLKKKLEGKNVLGAQLLDFYLKHPNLIPEDWKTKGWIFFWGTIYCDGDGNLYVRCLRWRGTRLISAYCGLDVGWNDNCPAAVSASSKV